MLAVLPAAGGLVTVDKVVDVKLAAPPFTAHCEGGQSATAQPCRVLPEETRVRVQSSRAWTCR